MPLLKTIHRNDTLRIVFPESPLTPRLLGEVHSEFLQLLNSQGYCHTVIVNLPAHAPTGEDLPSLLHSWRELTLRSGRAFKVNGIGERVREAAEHLQPALSL